MAKLTLVPGQPNPSLDVPPTGVLYDSDYGVAGSSLNLANLVDLTLFDIFSNGSTLYAAPMPSMEVLLTGTPIGGMTANGGLGAAFDGNLAKSFTASARSASKVSGYAPPNSIGLALTSPAAPTRFVCTSPTDNAFNGNNDGMFWEFIASTTNDIATGIVLSAGYGPPVNPIAGAAASIERRFPNGASYSYLWIVFYGSGNNVFVSQLRPFAQLPFSARGLISVGGVPMNAAAMPAAISNSGPVALPAGSVAYRGTILSGVGGLMHSTLSYGRDRILPIYNFSGRRRVTVVAGDPDAPNGTFTYTPSPLAILNPDDWTSFYPVNSDPNICVTVVNGLAEETIDAEFSLGAALNGTSPVGPTAYICAINVKKFGDPSTYYSQMGAEGQQNFDTPNIAQGLNGIAKFSFTDYGAFVLTPIEAIRGNTKGSFGEVNMRFAVTVDV